jgi:mannose-1-phosphate guanylyltransferase
VSESDTPFQLKLFMGAQMRSRGYTWSLVLAGGEGSRLRSLTTDGAGASVPKQFCSLFGATTLLEDALNRGRAVADGGRVCAIVADHHHRWWCKALRGLRSTNVIVQPSSRGTAIGILLPLLKILARDRLARIVVLPSDHFVRDEAGLARSLRLAASLTETPESNLVLLGIGPDHPDPEFGYIVPGRPDRHGTFRVQRFVEKPDWATATGLLDAGALWNSFIFAVSGAALLELYRRRHSTIVDAMTKAFTSGKAALGELYEQLPNLDFSRDVLEGAEDTLRVLAVPGCGWSDLGTPQRVAECVRRCNASLTARQQVRPGVVTLATAHLRSIAEMGVWGATEHMLADRWSITQPRTGAEGVTLL